MPQRLLSCPECHKELQTIEYKMWGTKRFNPAMGSYDEDESPGNGDLIFTCPHCEAEIDSDAVLA
jgi:hypothetical protein